MFSYISRGREPRITAFDGFWTCKTDWKEKTKVVNEKAQKKKKRNPLDEEKERSSMWVRS